ncbi:MAG: DNA-directed RNA polymerase subunit alpha [Flavobacteriales bacterium]|nr:DNA-directed RNA polymerase subunit alpha [Flavobacteriales bacterium]MCB0807966.1 DNA-directed RNA polymerase subunit alpha [Flavobacteriales bacterium]MCB0816046.1 DNA-directed RNA polymerase subunit alpha [Flavobacteriales bacterium]MCB9180094.1 DNA-directed RNA polymerase subunit alpha [Flavobacteriales bacterium]MCB9199600.1 DNA-directed RNA polymerase subunit alpha [Flavobacteriales bacterium]
MPILDFQRPDKVTMIESDDQRGTFEFRPLEPGYGITIGNALRRILLSSLEGFAITSVRIEGVDHEFSTIKGVIEDMTEIVLNLKQVRFRRQLEDVSTERVSFTVGGKDGFTAGDIGKHTTGFQVLNPELTIARMEGNVKLHVELTIGKGRGYVPADENRVEGSPIGTIYIDSIFTPIKNVRYTVENTRVEQKTDYEKLTIEVETDGSINPKDALQEAAKILIHHFMLFSDERITLEVEEQVEVEEFDETSLHMRQLLKSKLVDMDLSVRALNCLKAADIETLGDLVAYNKNDLLKFRNFGKKSLTELEDLVENKGLSFGMNVSKYKLEKE